MLDILARAGCYIAIIVLGNLLRRKGFFGEETFGVLSKIVIKITLPAALISSAAGRPIDVSMLTLSALGLGTGVMYVLAAMILHRGKDRESRAFAVVNTPGYNIGTFALPFTSSFLGPVGVLATSLFDVGNSFVVLGGSFGVARAVKEGGKVDVKRVLQAPLSSIPFLTHVMMVFLNLNGWNLPKPVIELAGIIGNANAFLAMLMIGVGFRLSGERSQFGAMARILTVRYGLAALVAAGFWLWLPFETVIRKTLVILAFAPIGSAVPVFTAELKSDVGLSSAINSISIVISIIAIVTLLMVLP